MSVNVEKSSTFGVAYYIYLHMGKQQQNLKQAEKNIDFEKVHYTEIHFSFS